MQSIIEKIAHKFKGTQKIDLHFFEPLSEHTSFKIGGPADLLIEPCDAQSLCFAMNEIVLQKIPHFVLGGGANVVFSDAGFRGVVVSTKKLGASGKLKICCECEKKELPSVTCPAGATMNSIVNFASKNGFSGLEEFAGLPGTVGGAVFMNARCFEKEISDVAKKIFWIEFDCEKNCFVQKEKIFFKNEWTYKKSPFTGTKKIITSAQFNLKKSEAKIVLKKASDFVKMRKEKGHFEYPCAGSVFKNNRAFGEPTGKILEGLGLKGKKSGGAQIAPFHANIIINTGGATCADVRALVELAKREAKERRGFELEEEIIFAQG